MRCPHCGYHSFEGLSACKQCGAALPASQPTVPRRQPAPPAVTLPELTTKRVSALVTDRCQPGDGLRSAEQRAELFPAFLMEKKDPGLFAAACFSSDGDGDRAVTAYLLLRRSLAALCDLLLLSSVWCAFVATGAWAADQPVAAFLIALPSCPVLIPYYLLAVVLMLGYFNLLSWFAAGQTPGKQLFGLRVVGAAGNPPTLAELLLRTCGGLLSLLCGGLGYLWIVFDPARRGWNDRLAGTRVEGVAGGAETPAPGTERGAM